MAVLKNPPSSESRTKAVSVLSYTFLILVTCALLLPIVWMVINSLKADSELITRPIQIFPNRLRFENYLQAVTIIPFGQFAANSAFLAITFSVLTVITSAMAGFAFARIDAPGRGRLFGVVVALLMVPNIVYVIPQFMIFSRLGLTNTYWPWILWGLSASPFHIFLFRQYFTTIPRELEDAAEVDGCGIARIFWQIFLPNAKPVLAVSFIFNFSWVWSDWFTPLIYLTDNNTTLAVKLAASYTDSKGNPLLTLTMAAAVIYTLPLVIMFFLGQKQILQGVVTSGLKG
jgi:multiple sugar transport system permease protein